MSIRMTIVAVSLAAVAAGCQTNKKRESTRTTAENEDVERQRAEDAEHQSLGEYGEEVAEETRQAAEQTIEATDRAEEEIFGEGETLPPEEGEDYDIDREEARAAGERSVGEELEQTAEAVDGKTVTASVNRVDRNREHVVFRIEEDVEEIQLQSGKEIEVPFSDLQMLTGLDQQEVLDKLEAADKLEVKVLGAGDAMRIVEIDLQSGKDQPKPDEGMPEDSGY